MNKSSVVIEIDDSLDVLSELNSDLNQDIINAQIDLLNILKKAKLIQDTNTATILSNDYMADQAILSMLEDPSGISLNQLLLDYGSMDAKLVIRNVKNRAKKHHQYALKTKKAQTERLYYLDPIR